MCTVFEMTWAEGKAEGRVEGIRALILDNLEEGISKERIILKLQKRFSLKEAEARKYMKEFAPS